MGALCFLSALSLVPSNLLHLMPSSLTLWPEMGNRVPAGFMGPGGAASFADSCCRSPCRQISKTGSIGLSGGNDEEGNQCAPMPERRTALLGVREKGRVYFKMMDHIIVG